MKETMLTLKDKLLLLGFEKLPSFDSEYFRYRKAVGFLVMVNIKTKQQYSVFTINAVTCIQSAIKLVKGEYADRARDLQNALQLSEIFDWELYFNKNSEDNSLRAPVAALLSGYASLNTNKSRLDQTKPTWAYSVTYKVAEGTERTFFISDDKELNNLDAISKFLLKWRSSLEAALNRGSLPLKQYYAQCETHSVATKAWLCNDVTQFSVVSVDQYAGLPRGEVVEYINRSNASLTTKYRRDTSDKHGVTENE